MTKIRNYHEKIMIILATKLFLIFILSKKIENQKINLLNENHNNIVFAKVTLVENLMMY